MNLYFLVVGAGVLFGIILAVIVLNFGLLWLRAFLSDAYVGMGQLVGMRLRQVNMNAIVNAHIMGAKAGLKLSVERLEAHYLAKGDVQQVVRAMIIAAKANIPLTFERATAINLAGRDVLEAVETSVNPKVIDCPDPSKGNRTIEGMAANGIQVKARARVTVRSNLDRLVGGATQETIIARVGEGIVSAIGSAESHKQVLEHPDLISKKVLAKGLDAGTAFEILSIDIAEVDVGKNIGAELQGQQAEADMRVAKAKAEERRAMAAAREQEMVALIKENRAKVVLAEAELPMAMAEAFRSGSLGVMDYYRMKNVVADTEMRSAIAGGSAESVPTNDAKS